MSLVFIAVVRSFHRSLCGPKSLTQTSKLTHRRAMATADSPLELKLSQVLERRRQESRLRVLKASPANSVDFSSNDFLSLATSSKLKDTYLKELPKGPFQLGSTGSRLLDGNSEYAEKLEKDIAIFHGGKAGLLANSGFDANVSIFACLPQPGDIIVYDELIHASVHDGMRQSRASKTISFSHNSVKDLRMQLMRCLEESKSTSHPTPNVFVTVESVYSMEGDVAPLKEIVKTVEELFPNKNAHIIVDEAHSNGVYGPQGKGLVSELGLEDRIFVRLHTFGKALACTGCKQSIPRSDLHTDKRLAIIICSETTRSYLINYARPLIYTTFMSFPSLAAIKAVYEMMMAGETMPVGDAPPSETP
jgi:8-amino-7-oxononanoate synthase